MKGWGAEQLRHCSSHQKKTHTVTNKTVSRQTGYHRGIQQGTLVISFIHSNWATVRIGDDGTGPRLALLPARCASADSFSLNIWNKLAMSVIKGKTKWTRKVERGTIKHRSIQALRGARQSNWRNGRDRIDRFTFTEIKLIYSVPYILPIDRKRETGNVQYK